MCRYPTYLIFLCKSGNYNVVDPRSEASTNSSMNRHSPQKQPCRMTSGSAETDMFLHSKILTRGQWILHLRPYSKFCFRDNEYKMKIWTCVLRWIFIIVGCLHLLTLASVDMVDTCIGIHIEGSQDSTYIPSLFPHQPKIEIATQLTRCTY